MDAKLSYFSRIEIFDQRLVRGEIFRLLQALFICFLSHRIFWCDKVREFLSPASFPIVNLLFCCFACSCCLPLSHTEPLAGRPLENLGRKSREERQKVHFFFSRSKKIKVFSSVSPTDLSGNISLDGFASPPSCLAGSSSFFNISLGTGT